jgi:hypothetical protein
VNDRSVWSREGTRGGTNIALRSENFEVEPDDLLRRIETTLLAVLVLEHERAVEAENPEVGTCRREIPSRNRKEIEAGGNNALSTQTSCCQAEAAAWMVLVGDGTASSNSCKTFR